MLSCIYVQHLYPFPHICEHVLMFTCTHSLQTDTFHIDQQLPKTVGKNRQRLVLIDLKLTKDLQKSNVLLQSANPKQLNLT